MKVCFSLFRISLVIILLSLTAIAQTPTERQQKIHSQVESGDAGAALSELQSFRTADPAVFAANNYDYLLARLSERGGDAATALVNYQSVVARNSILMQS